MRVAKQPQCGIFKTGAVRVSTKQEQKVFASSSPRGDLLALSVVDFSGPYPS